MLILYPQISSNFLLSIASPEVPSPKIITALPRFCWPRMNSCKSKNLRFIFSPEKKNAWKKLPKSWLGTKKFKVNFLKINLITSSNARSYYFDFYINLISIKSYSNNMNYIIAAPLSLKPGPHTTTENAHILQIKKSVAISNIHFYLQNLPTNRFSQSFRVAPSDVFLRSFALPATSKACKNSSDTSWICIFFSSVFPKTAKTFQNEQAYSSKKSSST